MSLKAFHVLFISVSVLLALGFGAWCLRAQPPWMAAGFLSLTAGVGLAGYEVWFVRKMRRLP
jgi:hypothetical protein